MSRSAVSGRIAASGRVAMTPQNLLLQSEGLNTGSWAQTNQGVPSVAAIAAPPGVTTVFKLTDNVTNGQHRLEQSAIGIYPPAKYTLSIFLQAAEYTWAQLRFASASSTFFNLGTGALGSIGSGTAGIQSVGGGWYRCWVTGIAATVAADICRIQIANGDNSNTFAGTGTSGIYAGGAQLVRADWAGPYGLTTTTRLNVTNGIRSLGSGRIAST